VYIFSEKLHFEDGKAAKIVFTKPIQVLLNITKDLRDIKKKRRSDVSSCTLWLP
jgi:hypothetical protein